MASGENKGQKTGVSDKDKTADQTTQGADQAAQGADQAAQGADQAAQSTDKAAQKGGGDSKKNDAKKSVAPAQMTLNVDGKKMTLDQVSQEIKQLSETVNTCSPEQKAGVLAKLAALLRAFLVFCKLMEATKLPDLAIESGANLNVVVGKASMNASELSIIADMLEKGSVDAVAGLSDDELKALVGDVAALVNAASVGANNPADEVIVEAKRVSSAAVDSLTGSYISASVDPDKGKEPAAAGQDRSAVVVAKDHIKLAQDKVSSVYTARKTAVKEVSEKAPELVKGLKVLAEAREAYETAVRGSVDKLHAKEGSTYTGAEYNFDAAVKMVAIDYTKGEFKLQGSDKTNDFVKELNADPSIQAALADLNTKLKAFIEDVSIVDSAAKVQGALVGDTGVLKVKADVPAVAAGGVIALLGGDATKASASLDEKADETAKKSTLQDMAAVVVSGNVDNRTMLFNDLLKGEQGIEAEAAQFRGQDSNKSVLSAGAEKVLERDVARCAACKAVIDAGTDLAKQKKLTSTQITDTLSEVCQAAAKNSSLNTEVSTAFGIGVASDAPGVKASLIKVQTAMLPEALKRAADVVNSVGRENMAKLPFAQQMELLSEAAMSSGIMLGSTTITCDKVRAVSGVTVAGDDKKPVLFTLSVKPGANGKYAADLSPTDASVSVANIVADLVSQTVSKLDKAASANKKVAIVSAVLTECSKVVAGDSKQFLSADQREQVLQGVSSGKFDTLETAQKACSEISGLPSPSEFAISARGFAGVSVAQDLSVSGAALSDEVCKDVSNVLSLQVSAVINTGELGSLLQDTQMINQLSDAVKVAEQAAAKDKAQSSAPNTATDKAGTAELTTTKAQNEDKATTPTV